MLATLFSISGVIEITDVVCNEVEDGKESQHIREQEQKNPRTML